MTVRRLAVRDERQLKAVVVQGCDLAVLAERAESSQLKVWRSVYLAVLEAAVAGTSWSRKELAARAGVGAGLLARTLEGLAAAGVLALLDDGSVVLGAGRAAEELVLVPPQRVEVPRDERAERFVAFHGQQVRHVRGGLPPDGPNHLAAARRILDAEPSSAEIARRLRFALGHRFYADKVLDMVSFERWWPKVSAAYLAEATAEVPAEASWTRVSYE